MPHPAKIPTAPTPTRAPAAWSSGRAVLRGAPPPGTVTLADLADPSAVMGLAPPPDASPRHRALMPVHAAVDVLVTAVLAPSAVDGLVVQAQPDAVGLVPAPVTDAGLAAAAVWVADGVPVLPGAPGRAGTAAAALLDPVLATARDRGRIGRRTAEALAEDSLVQHGVRYQALSPDPLWLNAFLAGAGYQSPRPWRIVTAVPDDGPPVVLPARRVCCVLSVRPDEGSCPTCPLLPDADRPGLVARWLQEVDDAEFAHLTGRRRVTARTGGTP